MDLNRAGFEADFDSRTGCAFGQLVDRAEVDHRADQFQVRDHRRPLDLDKPQPTTEESSVLVPTQARFACLDQ